MNGKAVVLTCGLIALENGFSTVTLAAEDSTRLEEVLVTAQKREETLQEVPIAVSAFSGDALAGMGVTDAQNIQNITPGFVFNSVGAVGSPFLRGVGTRLAVMGLEPSVATYIDDRYIARATGIMTQLADVNRVEVLKGPQGTLFGRNATGGAVRIITNEASDELEGSLAGSIGNYDFYSLSGVANVPITDDLAVRLTAMTKQRDGFVDNIAPSGLNQLDDLDFSIYRGKLRWNINDQVSAKLTMSYYRENDSRNSELTIVGPRDRDASLAAGGIAGRDSSEVATAIDVKNYTKEFASDLRFDVELDRFDIVSISTYTDTDSTYNNELDASSAILTDTQSITTEKALSQEFQLLSKPGGKLDWLVGVFYYETRDGEYDTRFNTPGPLRWDISIGDQFVETKAWAVFGQASWHMTDRWTLTVGGRQSHEEKEVELLASPLVPLTATPAPFADDDDWSKFTPKVTLEYRFNEDMMTYLSFVEGFKSGGYSYPASTNPVLDPEILKMYEWGFKGDFLNGQLRLNTSIYYYDYTDLQLNRSVGVTAGVTRTENAGSSELYGLDADIAWQPIESLLLTMGVNVLDTKYKRYEGATARASRTTPGLIVVPFDAEGHDLLRAADFSGFATVRYDLQLGEEHFPVSVTYTYKGDYYFDFVADPRLSGLKQDAYGLLNARISHEFGDSGLEVAVWGNNITDEEYFDELNANAFGLHGSYGEPRTYGMDVSYKF